MAVHGAHIGSDPLCYGPDPLHCCTRSNNRFLYVLYSSCCCFMHLFTAMPPALRAASSRDLSVAGLLCGSRQVPDHRLLILHRHSMLSMLAGLA